jgi:hypothetical protein
MNFGFKVGIYFIFNVLQMQVVESQAQDIELGTFDDTI